MEEPALPIGAQRARTPLIPLALGLLLAARGLAAEEWYDAYASGLEALRQKQGARAVEAFKRALKLRREPGTHVITYGTNKLERYFPYLRLAEAYLLVEDREAARGALRRSEAVGKEPAVERAGMAVLIESSSAKVRPALPPPPVATVPPDKDLLAGIRQVEEGRYEAGIATLEAVVRRLKAQGEPAEVSPQIAQAYLYIGIAYIGRSQEERLHGARRPSSSN